jgi:hypothetical protein
MIIDHKDHDLNQSKLRAQNRFSARGSSRSHLTAHHDALRASEGVGEHE